MYKTNAIGINQDILFTIDKYHLPQKQRKFISNFLGATAFDKRKSFAIQILEEVLKEHGKYNLSRSFTSLAKTEDQILELIPLRDHISHSVYVYLLGLYFKEKLKGKRIALSSSKVSTLSWRLAALLHDIGYPAEIFTHLTDEFFKTISEIRGAKSSIQQPVKSRRGNPREILMDMGVAPEIYDWLEKRLNTWGIDLNLRRLINEGVCRSVYKHDILSSLLVLDTIRVWYAEHNPDHRYKLTLSKERGRRINWDYTYFKKDIIDVAAAICVHQSIENVSSISLSRAPLAYLLVLCDTLQEWDRFAIGQRVYGPNSIKIIFNNSGIDFRLALPSKKLEEIKRTLEKLHSRQLRLRCFQME